MDCKWVKDNIDLYIDNMLDDEQTSRLVSHVKSCSECKKVFDDALLLKKAFASLEDIEPPPGLALSAIKKAKRSKFPTFAYASIGIAAAAALIIVFSSGIIPTRNNAINKDVAEEQIAITSTEDEKAGVFEGVIEAPALEAEMMDESAVQEAESASVMESDMAEESANEGPVAFDEPMQDGSRSICGLTFSGVDAQIFRQILDAFIEDYDIAADYMETDSKRTVSFALNEEAFEAFEALVYKDGLLYEGELYPGCYIEITFIK